MPEENTFNYATVWPKLTHDEKRLLLVMGAIYPLKDAVKHIGRDRKWLYKMRQKSYVRQAIEARNYENTNEVLRLVFDDMRILATVQLNQMLDNEILTPCESMQAGRVISRLSNL